MESSLSQNVLVLNRLWQAVNICTAQRAFSLLYQGHAQVIDSSAKHFQVMNFHQWRHFSEDYLGQDVVSAVTFRLRIPKVILLAFFDRLPKKEIKLTRYNIFHRDSHICQYCGNCFDRKELNLDHVIPRDQGGQRSWDNIVCSCIRCNSRKANRTPHQAGMLLLRQPQRPRWRPLSQVEGSRRIFEDWKHFLDFSRSKVQLS